MTSTLYLTNQYFKQIIKEIALQYKKSRCEITGSKKNLTVHHCISAKELIKQAAEINGLEYHRLIKDYNQEERILIIRSLHDLHRIHKDQLVTLERDIHKRYHEVNTEISEETYKIFKKQHKKRHR